jgi:hypothetical protein
MITGSGPTIGGKDKVHWEEMFPLLRTYIAYEDEEEQLGQRLFEEQELFLEANEKTLPKGKMYLNSRLHDSWVRNVEYDEHNVAITLNEFSTHCFCDALVHAYELDVPHELRISPIAVEFRNVSSCYVYSIGEEKILNTKAYLPKLSEWLYDEIRRIDSNVISVGVVFWAGSLNRKRRMLLFQAECEAMRFHESLKNEFVRLFGGKFTEQFASFWSERRTGRCFDYSGSLKFIDRLGNSFMT